MEAKPGDLESLVQSSAAGITKTEPGPSTGTGVKDFTPVADAPDPEEDDLDDLDGTLL